MNGVCSPQCSTKSSSCEVSCQKSWRIAVSFPSCVAPRRMRCWVRGRWPMLENIMRRSTLSFTGRFSWRAAASRQGCLRPRGKLAAESRADKARNDAHVFTGNAQHLRHHGTMAYDALRRVIEGHVLAVPHRDGAVHLHWIVSFYRRRHRFHPSPPVPTPSA